MNMLGQNPAEAQHLQHCLLPLPIYLPLNSCCVWYSFAIEFGACDGFKLAEVLIVLPAAMSDDGGGSAMSVDDANYHGHHRPSGSGGVWRDTSNGSAASARGAAGLHDDTNVCLSDDDLYAHVRPA